MTEANRTEDLVAAMREWADSLNAEHYLGTVHLLRKGADEIDGLRKVLQCIRTEARSDGGSLERIADMCDQELP